MNYRELISALKVGHVETVYVFTGREAYLREDALTRLRKKILPEGLADFNCTELTAPMTEDIIACAETLPMMADRRLIIVRDFTPLSGEEKKPTKAAGKTKTESADREGETLLAYLPRVPETSCIVFLAGEALDRRKKLCKMLTSMPGFVSFDPPDDADISSFLGKTAKHAGLSMERAAEERLLFYSGRDLSALSHEMEKLIAYAGDEGCIRAEHVELLATRTPEARVFDMIDAAVSGKTAKAYVQLRTLLAAGEARLGILALLSRQLRQMLYASDMIAAGRRRTEIAECLQVKPFVVERLERRVRKIPREKLLELLLLCTCTEAEIKNGGVREDAGLDRVLFGFSDLRETE
ncbi:MAG: DNA polymerase III subunit delta [Clostridiales bacterium]|nr:DNA polymerase III subunit delta [Clostridiales bacterium]